MISELNDRSREIFRTIVNSYLSSGIPVGSRTLSKISPIQLSPASIRNVMADLEELGLLESLHTSSGRIPSEQGLRLYVDGLMEHGRLSTEEQKQIEAECAVKGLSLPDIMTKASDTLSSLASCASLVIAPQIEKPVKHIQFVSLEPGKALIIMVMQNGMVENRLMEVPADIPASAFEQATNYLNARLEGKTVGQARKDILQEIKDHAHKLDQITARLVESGIAVGNASPQNRIIIRGQSRLLHDVKALEDLERARALLTYLEEQENMIKVLDSVDGAQGVQIFIGSDNKFFSQSGWSFIVSPYKNSEEQIVGAIGVIGPTRLDYDRIIPMVDYTSQILTRLIDDY